MRNKTFLEITKHKTPIDNTIVYHIEKDCSLVFLILTPLDLYYKNDTLKYEL